MFSSLVQFTVVLSSLATLVSAHGFVHSITLDGKTYKGGLPFTEGGSKNPKSGNPIWTIRNNGPAVPAAGKMATSRALACGREAIPAVSTAPVTAGSKVTIDWANWPHNSGPVITYLGACNGDCSKADPTKIKFFKIHEQGFVSGTTKWIQDTVLRARKPFTFTLPKNIPNGNFMMRHEIIALHLADKLDGAEFYPTCIQLNVKGGTGSVPSQTVTFPGGYKNTDAGIHFNIFNGNANLKKYKIPGPPIALTGATGVKSTTNDTVVDDTTDDDNVIIGDDNNGGDNTDDGNTGDDNNTGDDQTNDDGYTDEDGTNNGDNNGGDDTNEDDDSGCTGGDDDEEDGGNTDEPSASVSDDVATETGSAAPSETSSKGGKKNTNKGHGHGGHNHNHKHNHRSEEVVEAAAPRMVKRHRMHLALDLANQMSS